MSASFQEHLELALGDEYTVVRELGGGGMSRVFLAIEVALGRKVVIKVLTPELAAGVNRERFRREVQLAATLQHPLIVPVLSAGEAEGLLWYTMPFVEGESLRERLNRGVLSGREALPLLADVARALGAAHRKGIVHRDIKPGNILLHEQHAVVADFGVAKALTAATADSTGLTTSGLAVGTPAYMSPEQAAGDGTVDSRADIYALGCVAYEMMTGKTPFVDTSAARLLVAHVSQPPIPIDQLVGIRPGLARVIMRCLEKDPAMRWPTADALADAFEEQRYTSEPTPIPAPRVIDAPTTVTPPPLAAVPRRSRPWKWMVAGAAAALGVVVFLISSPRRPGAQADAFAAPRTVIVADVEKFAPDSTLSDLLGEALRTELQQSRFVTVMSPATTSAALLRMQKPPASRVDASLAREIAVREGAALVVTGRIQKVGNTYLLRAALLSPGDGTEQAEQETAASEDDLIAAIGRLVRKTRHRLGESTERLTALAPMEQVTTTSLDALRRYTESVRIGDGPGATNDAEREIELLEEAVRIDSTFAMAWRRLGVRLLSNGVAMFDNVRRLRGEAALTKAYNLRGRLSPVERGLTEGSYYSFVEQDEAKANAAYSSILQEQPGNRVALNNLSSSALVQGDFAKLREYGNRYVAVDSGNLQAWTWVFWGAYADDDLAEAHRLRDIAMRRFTSPDVKSDLDDMTMRFLMVERDWPGVERIARAQLATATGTARVNELTRILMSALVMRGRLTDALQVNGALAAKRLAGRDTAEHRRWRGDSLHESYLNRAWLTGDTTGLAQDIKTYVAVSGVDRWAMAERQNVNLVLDYALVGDAKAVRERAAAFKAEAVRQRGLGAMPPPGSPVVRALDGQVALSEGRPRDALKAFAPLMEPAESTPSPLSFWIGRAYLDAGARDSARLWLSRLTESKDPRRVWIEPTFRMPALRLLCEIADTPAQKQQSCGRITAEWKDADALLQPVVARARARLADESAATAVTVRR